MERRQKKMNDYRLEPSGNRPQRKRPATGTLLLIGLLALTLVLGAFYVPVLIDSTKVAAGPAAAEQLFQMDSSLVADQNALADLYDAVAPSVVSIRVVVDAPMIDILPDIPQQQGQGSGFIFDADGHIVTNNHVVEGAQEVTVVFYDGTWADAEVVATDPQADLAVLKVTPPAGLTWNPLPLATGVDLRVGHSVIAIGNPYGLESTMTTGIVSATGRSFPVGGFGENRYTLPDVIQTDAAINPGNSGGPLLNLDGQVVGVNFAIESNTGANSGVGFAIPVSIVEKVVPALIAEGSYTYPYLGLSGTSVGPEVARELELENTQLGAYVATVIPGGPADEAGIVAADPDTNQGGDIIIAFNGEPVRSFDDLVAALITTTKPGDAATLRVLRDGEEMDVTITVGERPADTATRAQEPGAEDGAVNAREAIGIAEQETEGMLDGEITERLAVPEDRDGTEVWVVELSTDTQTATVVIDRATGEVLEVSVQ
jgi:2-alkenal reductase